MTDKKVGRPIKNESDRFSHYLYFRLRADQDDKIAAIARLQGFSGNGGRSAAVRFAIDKVHALLFPPAKKERNNES